MFARDLSYEHIKIETNPEGLVLIWIVDLNGNYFDFCKVAQSWGCKIYYPKMKQNISSTLISSTLLNSDSNIEIQEDVESMVAVFELVSKIAIHTIHQTKYLKSLKYEIIPTIERDLFDVGLLSSSSLKQLEGFYDGFFDILMSEKDYNKYHSLYEEYSKLLQTRKEIELSVNKHSLHNLLSQIDLLEEKLIEFIQTYNLFELTYVQIIFYVEVVTNFFDTLINKIFYAQPCVQLFKQEKQYVIDTYCSTYQSLCTKVNLYHFSSRFASDINLIKLIAVNTLIK